MPKVRLTDIALQSLKAERRTDFWDASVPSFGVRVGPRNKTFIIKRNNRRLAIGRYPSISLSEARTRAKTLLYDSTYNPTSQITLEKATELFLTTHCKGYRPRSLYETERLLKKLMPLSQKKLSRITTHDVHDLIDQQVTFEATHLFKTCRTFFRWTVRRRYIDRSPLDGLLIPNKEISRARVLSDVELKKIWDACSNETNELPQHFKVIVKLLVCTGQRRGEVAALSPAYINDNVCELPNTLTKNSRTHIFPIGLLTKSLLKGLPSDKLLYFPARGTNSSKPFSGWSKAKIQLDQLSGVSDWTLHDIRRTVATRMAELGVAPHVVERILNHVTGTMSPLSRVYNRATFHSEMADALQLWENRLSTILKN